jgi:hypothetical protein
MRLSIVVFAVAGLITPTYGQMRNNQDRDLSCTSDPYRGGPRVCDLQETTLGPSGTLEIEPGRNGGVSIKGWAQNNVLVRARLEAWAPSEADAKSLLSQVRIEAGGGRIRAVGPDVNQNWPWWEDRNWAVSFEIFTPFNTDVKAQSHNGAMSVSDLRGRIDVESHNGSLRLTRVAGDVRGETHNGSVQIELEGNSWDGRGLEANTHNGSVTVSVPAAFSASVETKTDRGRLDSDFPMSVRGRIDQRDLSFNIGAGGPPIRVSTHNGGIRLRRR